MADLMVRTTTGSPANVGQSVVDAMSTALTGKVLRPEDAGYHEARTIWNAMIDRKPALILQCMNAADVQVAVQFARENKLLVSVRGGGHNIAGNAVCEGGLKIDLSPMKKVEVDTATRRVKVGPGVTLGELDAVTQQQGLAVPTGINSTTGIAGLTLGGGVGWLSRKYGMTIDNLVSAQVVTADGRLLAASASENPDLFWAIRGGGGNFGIVTEFEFMAHPVGPEIMSGLVVHPFAAAKDALKFYREFVKTVPDEVTVWNVSRKAPPLPFLPEEWHGKEVLVFACACAGDMSTGENLLKPLREFGSPIADVIGPHPFAGWQQAFDPLLTPGARNYWKTHDFLELSDALIDVLVDAVSKLPSPHCEVFIGQVGGAQRRVPADATAYNGRDANFIMNVHGRWETPAEDESCIRWCRNLYDASTPYATGAAYVNFMTEEEAGRVQTAYGPNYARLVELKRKYDPQNLFRMNQNICPE